MFHTALMLDLTRALSMHGPLSAWQQTSLHWAQVGHERELGTSADTSGLRRDSSQPDYDSMVMTDLSLKICMRRVCCITARGSHQDLSPVLTRSVPFPVWRAEGASHSRPPERLTRSRLSLRLLGRAPETAISRQLQISLVSLIFV